MAGSTAKYIYACLSCGYSFYLDAEDSLEPPAPTCECPQCADPRAEFSFVLGGSVTRDPAEC